MYSKNVFGATGSCGAVLLMLTTSRGAPAPAPGGFIRRAQVGGCGWQGGAQADFFVLALGEGLGDPVKPPYFRPAEVASEAS